MALSCLFAIAWNSAVADVITTGTWTYDEDEPLVTDVSQISTNSITCENEDITELDDALFLVIDEDWSTYHHSCWYSGAYDVEFGPNDPDELPYLQFDLEDEYDLLQIYIVSRSSTYAAYNDCPAVVNMYGTNDADDEDSWTFVAEINFAESGAAGVQANTEFTSEPFQSDTAYRYWRFEVTETSNNRTDDNENGDYELLFAVAEVQFYVPYEITDQAELLTLLVDSVSELGLSFIASTEPGYYDSELVAAYQAAFDAAEEATYETHTDEEYIAYGNALREALAAVIAGINPLPAGFYYIVSPINFYYTSTDEDTYGENISVTKAIYEDDDALYWDTLDEEDVNYMWTVTELEDGGYALQNYGTKNYIYGTDTEYTAVPTAADLETTHYIQGIGDGTFAIYSNLSAEAYHPQGHSSGTGESGPIVIWEDEYSSDNSNVWYFEEVELDDETLNELSDANTTATLLAELQELVDEAYDLYAAVTVKTVLGDGLITDVSQFSSNAKETSEGDYESLLDGVVDDSAGNDGFFHSEWSDVTTYDDHFLQVALNEQVSSFVLLMWARDNMSADDYVDFPEQIRIYATNDESIGTSTETENDEWDEVYYLEIEDPETRMAYQYTSDPIVLDEAYQYFRFVVELTLTERANDGGLYYFTLSEFQMYKYTIDEENAQYAYVEGMQEATDAMMAAVATAEENIEAGTTTSEEVDNLAELIAAVEALYVSTDDYDEIDSEADALLAAAVVGETPGCVSQDAYDALEAAIAEAAETVGDRPTKETVAEAVAILEAAIEAFNDAVIGIVEGQWYYIYSGSTDEDYTGRYMYASSEVFYEGSLWDGYVRHAAIEDEEQLLDLRFMWRFIQASDSTYYIQNRAFGTGPCTVGGYYSYLQENSEYQVVYVGNGAYEFDFDEDGTTYTNYLYATYNTCVTLAYPGYERARWCLQEVDLGETGEEYVIVPVLNNNIRVQTYASNVGTWYDGGMTVMEMNEDVYTYAVKSLTYDESTGETTVELSLQDEFAAGEPFVLVVGDYNSYGGYLYVDESDTISILLPVPTDFAATPGTSNGLVGIYASTDVEKEGLGYILWDDDEIDFLISDDDEFYVSENSGYFVPTTETGTGSTDLTIVFEDGEVTAVTAAPTTTEAQEAVYDLQGRQVAAPQKGIYIVGGKKVIYK